MNRRRRLTRRLLSAVAIAAVFTVIGAFGLSSGAFVWLQDSTVDGFLFPSAKADPHVVVVGFDNETYRDNGYPLPRKAQAQIARQLARAGASVVAWDVVFATSANTSERPDLQIETTDLANAIKELESTGAAAMVGVAGDYRPANKHQILGKLTDEIEPTSEIGDVASVVNVNTDLPDGEGVIRSVPLVVQKADGSYVPSLSLAAVLAYRGASLQPVLRPGGVQAGDRFVPTKHGTSLTLNWAQGLDADSTRPSFLSAASVIAGDFDPKQVAGKIVLVGATAELAHDTQKVPIDKSGLYPGVFTHANAINTMLTSSYISTSGNTETVIWIAVLTLLAALAVLFFPLWVGTIVTLALALLYLVVALVRFDDGHVMNLVYPFAMLAASYFAAVIVRYFTETRHRQRVSKLFAQYVPETVAQQLVEEGRVEQAAEGERLDVSLFFCDLRGFTAMSANLTPQQVRIMLNEFYDTLTEIILEYKGTVLKFVGDEVFAVFGAPLPVENHPQVTLDCALAIQRAAPDLSARLADMDIPAVHFGIGMNSGEVVAAHVGGGRRRQYDIVGDTVNIGSRMCGQAGKGDVVMPIDCYKLLSDPPRAESMGLVALKNVEQPMELMRIRVDWSPDAVGMESAAVVKEEIRAVAAADDATMKA